MRNRNLPNHPALQSGFRKQGPAFGKGGVKKSSPTQREDGDVETERKAKADRPRASKVLQRHLFTVTPYGEKLGSY